MTTTTQKAEGLLNTPGLSLGEKQFLQSILEFLEQAKDDPKPDVALAARKWESSLIYRIRVTLQRRRKTGNTVERVPTKIQGNAVKREEIPARRVNQQASRLCYPAILKEAA